jgi:hypothetical protein
MHLNCKHQHSIWSLRQNFDGSVDWTWKQPIKTRRIYLLKLRKSFIKFFKNYRYIFQLLFDVQSHVRSNLWFWIYISYRAIQQFCFTLHFHLIDYNLGMLQIQNSATVIQSTHVSTIRIINLKALNDFLQTNSNSTHWAVFGGKTVVFSSVFNTDQYFGRFWLGVSSPSWSLGRRSAFFS